MEKKLKTILRFCLPSVIMLLIFMGNLAGADKKDKYRPYSHGFPQIIQKDDYKTIKVIESLFPDLKRIGKEDIFCEVNKDAIVLRSRGESNAKIVISVPPHGPITIGRKLYRGRNEISLFTTLRKLLADLSKQRECAGINYEQFSTRGYKKRTILEFDFGQHVVTLDASSNGPKDAESLYILDLVERRESFFWGKIN